jgi:tight adherence protein B
MTGAVVVAAGLLMVLCGLIGLRRYRIRARWRSVQRLTRPRPAMAVPRRARRLPTAGPVAADGVAATPGRAVVVAALVASTLGGFGLGLGLGGPLVGVILAAYAVTGTVMGGRLRRRGAQSRARAEAVDAVAALAADLRAGLSMPAALAAFEPVLARAGATGGDAATVVARVGTAAAVAQSSGAPLADVMERLDLHLRTAERARSAAAAQAAGARASAVLLAAMPAAGLGLGVLIGVDPWRALTGTPLGSLALATAAVLQLGGLAWSARLARVDVPS